MNKIVQKIWKGVIAAIAVSFTFLSGCDLWDDYSHCRMAVHLHFLYTLNEDYVDKFADQVSHTDLFVYDRSGNLLQTQRVETSSLDDGSMDLPLLPGEYRIVVWSNLNDTDYTVLSQNDLSQMQVRLNTTTGDAVATLQSALFHGMTDVEVIEKYTTDATIEMTKDVNDIHVILYTENGTPETDYSDYTMEITGSNGTYNYDNSKATSALLHYMPLGGYRPWSENNLSGIRADMRVMRLSAGDDLHIIIRLGDDILYDEPLTALILSHPSYGTDEDLDRYDDFTLRFQLKTYSLDLISINDWDVVNGNTGI